MEFCPKCGKRLEFRHGRLVCPKCGYSKKASVVRKRSVCSPQQSGQIVIVDREITPLPTLSVKCPKCGFNKAYVWQVQTRSADEASTQFFRCVRCGYTWREYS